MNVEESALTATSQNENDIFARKITIPFYSESAVASSHWQT